MGIDSGEEGFHDINLCVCDMNCDASEASSLLAAHVLPYMCYSNSKAIEMDSKHNTDSDTLKINAQQVNDMTPDNLFPNSAGDSKSKTSVEFDKFIILTLKLIKNPKEYHIVNAVNTVKSNFSSFGCVDFKVVHLNANSKNERTLICRIKSSLYIS
jgi:hypothetical protein